MGQCGTEYPKLWDEQGFCTVHWPERMSEKKEVKRAHVCRKEAMCGYM